MFGYFLMEVTLTLIVAIFAINVLVHRAIQWLPVATAAKRWMR